MSDQSDSSSDYEAPDLNSGRKRKVKSAVRKHDPDCTECQQKFYDIVTSEEGSLTGASEMQDEQIQLSDSEEDDDSSTESHDSTLQKKRRYESDKNAALNDDRKRSRISLVRENVAPSLDLNNLAEEHYTGPSCSHGGKKRKFNATFKNKSQQPGSSPTPKSSVGYNLFNGSPNNVEKSGLRPIIIDGSNVAFSHGKRKVFSSKGIETCINYFVSRKHKVYAFVPQFRACVGQAEDTKILHQLEKDGHLIFTPSRWVDDKLIKSYDDRYIVQSATELGGVIVSRDNYRDLMTENPLWEKTIKERLLMFTWVEDLLIFPVDPLGRNGPSLKDFLKF